MSSRFARWVLFVVAGVLAGCFGSRSLSIDDPVDVEEEPDAATTADAAAVLDARRPPDAAEAAPDAAVDDARVDAEVDDAGADAGPLDAAPDAAPDAGFDAGSDAGFDAGPPPALTGLAVSAGVLSPAFSPATLSYDLTVSPWLEAAVLVPSGAAGDTIQIEGALVASSSPSTPLSIVNGKTVSITVSRGDRSSIYAVKMVRAADTSEYFKASNPGGGDSFGCAVALSGDTLAIGAYNEASGFAGTPTDDSAAGAGAVYMYSRAGGSWQPIAYLKASNIGAGDRFGESLALDGDTLVVGARFEDSNANTVNGVQANEASSNSGAAYVFRNVGGTWTQEAYLKPSNAVAAAEFGSSVAIKGDRIAVGAIRRNGSTGGAWVFHRAGGAWQEEKALAGTDAGDGFGISVAIDDARLVVGARQASAAAARAGAAYVYARVGTEWDQEAILKAPNARPAAVNEVAFASRVRLSGDLVAVADPFEYGGGSGVGSNMNDTSMKEGGAVYLYRRGATTWAFEAYVKASNPSVQLRFGSELVLEGDRLIVATPLENGGGDFFSGAAYSFRRVGGVWFQEAKLKTTGTRAFDSFGSSLAISNGALVVGATGEDSAAVGVGGDRLNEALSDSGAAFLFP